ncbi:hypothetical protein [Actinophytocola sp.]|uniref:hypothetical protein n=1 Tax=Actinophytocola sp. TaxID=1872138 RepID=UPI003D6AF6C5
MTNSPVHPELPFPIECRLPQGWRAVAPHVIGAPDAAFVALRPEPGAEFTPNITVGGEHRPAEVALPNLAAESADRLRRYGQVRVDARAEVGSVRTPGFVQALTLTTTVDGEPRRLAQRQVYVSTQDTADPARRAVVELVLTTSADRIDEVLEDFVEFLRSVRSTVDDRGDAGRRAETLRVAAQADSAPGELRALAVAVREGRTSWTELAEGGAAHVPEVRELHAALAERTRRLRQEWNVPGPRSAATRAGGDRADEDFAPDWHAVRKDPW